MGIPSPLPLDAFERAIQADPDVLGAFYFGSLGRGAATRYSDLDIFVWLADDMATHTQDKLVELIELFGEIHLLDIDHGTGYVGPGWTQVDVEYGRREELKPHYRYAGALVVKDTDGVLAEMAAACAPEPIVETVESAMAVMRDAMTDQLFGARHNARGSVWSATGGIVYELTLTYELLGRLRGKRTYGYRYVEDLLSPEEASLLAAAWPRESTREENRRAARCLWAWTKHVWREAERAIGQPLSIEVDEEGFLAAIDGMYE